jgi:exo-beta-1,3-glucanase (GH17 family)
MTPIIAAVDWVGLNSHAYWHGLDPTTRKSGAHVIDGALRVAEKTGKPTYVTETGYPSRGESHTGAGGTANTSESRLSLFLYDVEMAAREAKQPVYLFEPFDGDWKRRWSPFVEMDYSFGFAYCNRTMKDIKMPPLGAQ